VGTGGVQETRFLASKGAQPTPTRGGRKRLRLASGPGYSAHGDFINRWQPAALQQRIDDCLKPVIKCGPDGRPLD
jgi:hypothetical protein